MTRDAVRGSGSEILFVIGALSSGKEMCPEAKTPQLSSEVWAVTEISSIRKDSFGVRLMVEAEYQNPLERKI